MKAINDGKLLLCQGIVDGVCIAFLSAIKLSSIFTKLYNHMYDSTVDDSQVLGLIKKIVHGYCKIRLYHLC